MTYGTKYGATAGIAEKIGQVLQEAGLDVDIKPAGQAGDPVAYQAVVLGSAVYIGRWRKEAAEFLQDHEKTLAERPVWLFSSGPLGEGDAAAQAEGYGFPKGLQPVADRIRPRDSAIFHGAVDMQKLNPFERAMFKMAKSSGGDFARLGCYCGLGGGDCRGVEGRTTSVKAIVVYEFHWGNTAAAARAIAEGIGPDARALSTAEATGEALAGVDLLVAGSPLLGFSLPTESMLKGMATNAAKDPTPPDLSHPSMRAWLETVPVGSGGAAAFETRIWWSPGSAAKAILKRLEELGYQPAAKAERFIVEGKYGPLRAGELERAKAWGAELAQAMAWRAQISAIGRFTRAARAGYPGMPPQPRLVQDAGWMARRHMIHGLL